MKFTVAAASLACASSALAGFSNETTSCATYTTVFPTVVTEYTTYCPEPTEIVHGDKTITVTSAGTVTITECPCTIDKTTVLTTSSVVPTGKPSSAASSTIVTDTTIEVTKTFHTVVSEYTTYCPEPTTLTHGEKTIVVTEPGTVTVSECPCTIATTSVETTSTAVTATVPASSVVKSEAPSSPAASSTVITSDTTVEITKTFHTVVSEYTTYCPEPTTLTHGDNTIVVPTAGTVTVSECPCTIATTAVETTSTSVVATVPVSSAPAESAPVESVPAESTTPAPATSGNSTVPVEVATGAAASNVIAPLAGVIAIAAFFL